MKNEPTRFHLQTQYEIKTLLMFVASLAKNESLKKPYAKSFTQSGLKLFDKVESGETNLEEASHKINGMIKTLNEKLSALYPPFQLTHENHLVTNHVLAFQQYLTQEAHSGKMNWKEEISLFEEATKLWTKSVSLSPKEGMTRLSKLIIAGNHMLPEDDHYPLPDPALYSAKL
ncbi:MAG: hypothetical protein KDK55_03770 [Chlamydiia bacterium]|nr:hypothetical protein [Chlamydiia bacterium]